MLNALTKSGDHCSTARLSAVLCPTVITTRWMTMPQEQYTISVTDPQMWRCQSVNTEVNRTVMITMEHRSSDIEGFDTLGSVMKTGQRLALSCQCRIV